MAWNNRTTLSSGGQKLEIKMSAELRALWKFQERILPRLFQLPGPQAFLGLWAHHSHLGFQPHITFSSSPLCLPQGVSLTRTLVVGFRDFLNNLEWACPKIFKLIISVMSPFPNKVTFSGSGNEEMDVSFRLSPFSHYSGQGGAENAQPGCQEWMCKSLTHVWLFATPWAIQSMEFSRPEYWSGWPFPSPGDLPNPGIKHTSPALQVDSLPAELPGESWWCQAHMDSNWAQTFTTSLLNLFQPQFSLSLCLLSWVAETTMWDIVYRVNS